MPPPERMAPAEPALESYVLTRGVRIEFQRWVRRRGWGRSISGRR
jgi:hypothetical protein